MDVTIPGIDWPLLGVVEAVWVVALSLYILLEGRTPLATLAWILGLALLPGLGIPIYLVFGPRKLARKRRRRALARSMIVSREGARLMRESRTLTAAGAVAGDPALSLAELGVRAGEPPPLRCDEVTLYVRGQDCFDAIVQDIEHAKRRVHLEYSHLRRGKSRDAHPRRARAQGARRCGGSSSHRRARLALARLERFLAPLEDAGAHIAVFNRLAFASYQPKLLNFRSHRKIVCVDGTIGFTGGMNVQDGHDESAVGDIAWRDTHVKLVGDAVAALKRFLEDWTFATGILPDGAPYVHAPTGTGDHLVQIVASGPDLDSKFGDPPPVLRRDRRRTRARARCRRLTSCPTSRR